MRLSFEVDLQLVHEAHRVLARWALMHGVELLLFRGFATAAPLGTSLLATRAPSGQCAALYVAPYDQCAVLDAAPYDQCAVPDAAPYRSSHRKVLELEWVSVPAHQHPTLLAPLLVLRSLNRPLVREGKYPST